MVDSTNNNKGGFPTCHKTKDDMEDEAEEDDADREDFFGQDGELAKNIEEAKNEEEQERFLMLQKEKNHEMEEYNKYLNQLENDHKKLVIELQENNDSDKLGIFLIINTFETYLNFFYVFKLFKILKIN